MRRLFLLWLILAVLLAGAGWALAATDTPTPGSTATPNPAFCGPFGIGYYEFEDYPGCGNSGLWTANSLATCSNRTALRSTTANSIFAMSFTGDQLVVWRYVNTGISSMTVAIDSYTWTITSSDADASTAPFSFCCFANTNPHTVVITKANNTAAANLDAFQVFDSSLSLGDFPTPLPTWTPYPTPAPYPTQIPYPTPLPTWTAQAWTPVPYLTQIPPYTQVPQFTQIAPLTEIPDYTQIPYPTPLDTWTPQPNGFATPLATWTAQAWTPPPYPTPLDTWTPQPVGGIVDVTVVFSNYPTALPTDTPTITLTPSETFTPSPTSTPDNSLIYGTVVKPGDTDGQAVVFRYQVDAGQVAIFAVLMLQSVLFLMIMLIMLRGGLKRG